MNDILIDYLDIYHVPFLEPPHTFLFSRLVQSPISLDLPLVQHPTFSDLPSVQPSTSLDLPLLQPPTSSNSLLLQIDTSTQLDLPPAIPKGRRGLHRPRLLPPPPPLFLALALS